MTAGASRLKQLVETARGDAADARCALLREITDIFLAQANRCNAAEMQHFDAILSLLTQKAAPALKREIADRLADAPIAPNGAPYGVIAQLAQDEINVADPILRRSQTLTDADFIAIISTCGPAHQKALSRRRDISEAVTGALVEHGDEEALASLAKNQGARFSLHGMQAMIAQARRRPALQAPLTGRYDLPPQLLTQLYFLVSTNLKQEILRRSDMLDPSLIEVAVIANRRRTLEQAAREAGEQQSEAKQFIADKIRSGGVDEDLLRLLLAEKRRTAFVFAFAHLVGVDMTAAQAILKDRTYESLAVACRATGIQRQTFAKIVFSLRRTEDSKAKALRILDLYSKVPAEAAERIMRFWRMRSQAGRDAAFISYPEEGEEGPWELLRRHTDAL